MLPTFKNHLSNQKKVTTQNSALRLLHTFTPRPHPALPQLTLCPIGTVSGTLLPLSGYADVLNSRAWLGDGSLTPFSHI